jgi:DegV family protein with EDD domain
VDQRVAVVTDTTHYLPPELVERNGIHQVSLYVNWQGRTDRESDLPGFDGYYEHLRTAEELPTTSQPSVGDFVAAYEPLLADGGEVVSVHLAAGLSGTCESAQQAKQRLEEEGKGGDRIHIVDSATACGGEGFIVLAAAAAVRAGKSGEEAAAHAHEARENLKMWFAIDTMEFLRRGGRVGAARAWLGSTLKIKPILTVESQITPVERVRTSRRAFERMVDYMRSRKDDGADAWVVQHIQAPDEAAELVARGRDVFGNDPVFVSEVGPVIGTHVGPGLLGTGGLPSSYLE